MKEGILVRNRHMCRIVVAICLLAMLVPFAIPTSAAEPDRYGYTLLTNDNQRLAYRALAEGISRCKSSITFVLNNVTQETLDDVGAALDMIPKDYPEYFWFSGGGRMEALGNRITVIPHQYTISGKPVTEGSAELENAKTAFEAAVKEGLSKIPAGASNYQKTEILHDYLAERVTYFVNNDDQTAYGALVLGKAVCAGYTRAYQYLLHRAGILSWYVFGQSYSPEGQLVRHAWNLVWLDGCCYYTDVTWDDQGEQLFHYYLNLSLEQMQVSHFTNDPLPASCGHTQYSYFKMNAAPGKGICEITGSESGGDIAKYFILRSLEGDQVVYTCDLLYSGTLFMEWMKSQVQNIVQSLGLTGEIQYLSSNLGSEYQVTIIGALMDSGSAPAPSTPNVGGEETPLPNIPPISTQPSEQPVPTPSQPQQQPTEQPATPETTAPAGESEPTAAQGTKNPTVSPETDPTQPTEMDVPGNKAGSIVIPIIAGIIVLAAGGVVFVLTKRKH